MNKYFELITKNTEVKIISTSECKHCASEFALYNLEKEVLDKEGFKYPDICPLCRFRMLYSYINDRHLYHREDSFDNSDVVSVISRWYTEKVMEAQKYKDLMVDDEALKYWKNLWQDIFADFKQLDKEFPKYSRMTYPSLENALYASHCGWAKNLYLSFCVFEKCEDIFYSYRILGNCKVVFNSLDVSESSEVYGSRMIENSHDISFSSNVSESSNLLFCYNMQNCNDSMLSCNKVNAKYNIWNKEYQKEDYLKKKSEIMEQIKTPEGFKRVEEDYREFLKENLVEPSLNIQNSEAIAGDNIYYSKNNINCFKAIGNENTINTILTGNEKTDTMKYVMSSIEAGQHCENIVWSCSFGQWIYNIFFCNVMTECNNCYYSLDLQNCEECMFSMWLRNKKYCILNKQYDKKEYFEIKEKIITYLKSRWEWWDFLWFDVSTFPYNDTSSYDFWKVNKVIYADGTEKIIDPKAKWIVTVKTNDFISEAVLDLWGAETIDITWRTQEKEVNVPDGMNIFTSIPSIDDVPEDILEKAIICEQTGRPFRVIESELNFLKKKWFPLPYLHHEVRIDKLLSERPLGHLYVSNCDACKTDMLSVFNGSINYKVYCPECYKDYMFK